MNDLLKKSVLSFILMFSVIVFVGCSGNDVSSEKADDNDMESKGETRLKVYVPSNVEEFPEGKDLNNNEIVDFISEETGYDIEWMMQPRENVAEKINIMMSSGDVPDLIVTTSKEIYSNLAAQGLLAPLDKPLNQIGTRIMETVPEETWKAVTYEEEIYAIAVPQNQISTYGMIIRKDWLEDLDLSIPETLDEFYETMKLIQKSNPGGKETIPLLGGAGDGNGDAFGYIQAFAGAFGLGSKYVEKDGQVIHTYTGSQAKDFLKYMQKLYQEGLLDPEYPVNKKANIQEKLAGGRAAMATIGWSDAKGVVEAIEEKDSEAVLEYIHPPIGPDGQFGFQKNAPVRTYMLVPNASKHVEEVVDFINKYMDHEVLNTVSYGWEEEHYNKEEDGLIVETPEAEEIRFRIYYTLWDTEENFNNRVRLKGFSPYYDPITDHATYTDITDYAPPIEVVVENEQTLEDLTNEYFIKIISGALSIDAFDEYVEKWNSSGGEASLTAINNWYQETFK